MNAITTSNLSRSFDGRPAVVDLSLAIPEGAVFGFLGPNGAGKTTTVRMLTALIAPSSGNAIVAGQNVAEQPDSVRQRVGMLTETPGLYERLSARDNLQFFGELYGLSRQHAAERADHYLRLFELWERRDSIIGGFSKGMRQKVAIARALLHDPAVVFLDEPTSGLDPEAARVVRDMIVTLRSEGRTIFLTTHNLAEAEALCTLIGIFRTRLLRLDTPAGLRAAAGGVSTVVRLASAAAHYADAVAQVPGVRRCEASEQTLTVTLDNADTDNPRLVQALVGLGAPIRTVTVEGRSLEAAYLELVNRHEPASVEHM